MSNRYEQSLKEQAARIRRELAGEKETKPVERPKKEEREDRFVLTDVPSPIYGFQRPRKQRSIQEEIHSEESEVDVSSVQEEEKSEESLEHETEELNEESRIETMEQTDLTEADAGLVPMTDSEILVPEPSIEENSSPEDIVENQVEAQASTETLLPEEEEDAVEEAENPGAEETDKEETVETQIEATPEVPVADQTVQEETETIPSSTDMVHVDSQMEEPLSADDASVDEMKQVVAVETEPTANQSIQIKKPVGPPVNVVMTTKDLMAMYRARREQNNLHGKK
ncbi:hypothetical protein ABIC15_000520 [Exiguobacterium sp. PvP048]|uniref:Uncharacterized protein n=1 Tax=Exiguobacterium sibiricum (strain DSM 17290 / CCUG 55495 / CIP 109462 / JCM 13490 / 255-15) TaxID=262543 RepID=B1YKE9_EXIS2|nr:hypothetical protein [Exiguobacterium sibiricum]ACB61702.1 hypothetical protein Exig_2250 [Exiguobacterium sibiricum 255-15]